MHENYQLEESNTCNWNPCNCYNGIDKRKLHYGHKDINTTTTCQHFLETFSVIIIDDILEVRHSFTQFEASYPKACPLPDGGTCTIQHSNSNADVVFRLVRAVSNYPLRYWPGQILAVLIT